MKVLFNFQRTSVLRLAALLIAVSALPVHAFCGFYVAKADTKLFNKASQVVLVRDETRTVLTMANDFSGDVRDFAVVIPVPAVLQREQIHVAEPALVEHLDAYTSPRLVEYFDNNPCMNEYMRELAAPSAMKSAARDESERRDRANSLGVTIEATYTVGEYDILILSATQSSGLVTWLQESGYRLPNGAERVVNSYLKQGMRFFVAKVNLEEQTKAGFNRLRPLQVAYEHDRFMLPIRLGTVNADGPQELFVYALTKTGRVETSNYRTVKLPSDVNVPVFIKSDFANFYRDMFSKQTAHHDGRVVFLEYAWDMGWCDPCAADPLTPAELRELGVFWLPGDESDPRRVAPGFAPAPSPQNVFVTRLHVRYDGARFPEDLMFKETGDRSNFQGRYILQHAFTGVANCPEAQQYYGKHVPERRERELQTLVNLTGWDIDVARTKFPALPVVGSGTVQPDAQDPWWRRIWR